MKGGVTVTDFDIKTIQEQITKFDMMLRPCALFINPSRVSELKEAIPDIEEKFLIVPSEMVQDDTVYLIDRKKIAEPYLNGEVVFIENDEQGGTKR